MVTVEELYKICATLADAKEKAGEHQKEFSLILSAVKAGTNEKRLASQFIARFFKYFPQLSEQCIESLFDLCEDDEVNIRKQAIKDLPALCKDSPENVQKVADILAQLLQTEDATEQSLVQKSLTTLIRANPKGTMEGLFGQITQADEMIRERVISFLNAKLKSLVLENLLSKEAEEYFVEQSKKILNDVSGPEFVQFMRMLTSLPSMSTLLGRQQLLAIVTLQADLTETFQANDTERIAQLVQCTQEALPLFSKNAHSDEFVKFTCVRILPVLGAIEAVDSRLEFLKLLAETVQHCSPELDALDVSIANIYKVLLTYMPLPTATDGATAPPPNLEFSYVECLMYSFHQLARHRPQFLVAPEHSERLKDFKLRLQYFARGVQLYIKQLKLDLQGKTGKELNTDENQLKAVALKAVDNINTLIKDLFRNPPAYKATVTLSFKILVKSPTTAAATPEVATSLGVKRITPVKFDAGPSAKVTKSEAMINRAKRFGESVAPTTDSSNGSGNRGGSTYRGWRRGRGSGPRGGGFSKW